MPRCGTGATWLLHQSVQVNVNGSYAPHVTFARHMFHLNSYQLQHGVNSYHPQKAHWMLVEKSVIISNDFISQQLMVTISLTCFDLCHHIQVMKTYYKPFGNMSKYALISTG